MVSRKRISNGACEAIDQWMKRVCPALYTRWHCSECADKALTRTP